MVAKTLEFLCLSCRECLLLRCDGNAGNSFPSTQGIDPSVELGGRNGAHLDVAGTLVLPLEWRRVCQGTPGCCHHSQCPPDVSVHSRETCFPCTASTFKVSIDSHHGGTWDSPVGKPRGKASWESLEGKPQIP